MLKELFLFSNNLNIKNVYRKKHMSDNKFTQQIQNLFICIWHDQNHEIPFLTCAVLCVRNVAYCQTILGIMITMHETTTKILMMMMMKRKMFKQKKMLRCNNSNTFQTNINNCQFNFYTCLEVVKCFYTSIYIFGLFE